MFVDKFKLPLLSKWFVNTGIHCAKGSTAFVLCNRTYCPPAAPLVAVRFKVVPDKLMPVMVGTGLTAETILNVPSVVSVFVFHSRPVPGVAGTMLVNAPLPGVLNSRNESLVVKVPDWFGTFSTPP